MLTVADRYTNKQIKGILGQRTTVVKEVQAKVPKFSAEMANKADFYYGLRNQLIHERTTVPINDRQIEEYRKLIQSVLKLLFGWQKRRRAVSRTLL